MRQLLLLIFSLAIFPLVATAQTWTDMGGFPDDTTFVDAMHGVAVDGAGKVWLQPWAATAWLDPATGDSIRDANGAAVFTRTLFVYNADGTSAMDPIRTITVGGTTDTLAGNLRGLRRDHNGDILVATGAGELYRIDHTTGDGMDKAAVAGGSLSAPGVSDNGTIFVANVVPGAPIQVYAPDFTFQENAVDSSRGFSRSFDVSADGNTIYWAGYSNKAVYRYSRPDEFSPFGAADTLLRGMVSEAIVRHPVSQRMWFSNAPAAGADPEPPFAAPEQYLTWYEWDPSTETIVDSLKYTLASPVGDEKARGISFSPDGRLAYVVIWDTNGNTSVRVLQGPDVSSIERLDDEVPSRVTLTSNYPNPFRGETTLKFSLERAADVDLGVFDIQGRRVATLARGLTQSGTYSATFDADGLASGTYFYHLVVDGQRLSGKMLLVK